MAELDGRRDVYISGLPKDVDDAMLKEIFQPYGEVTWCRALPRDGKARQAQATGASGLVEFGTPEQAAWVVQNMKGSVPTGLTEPIEVKFKDDPNTRWGGKGGAGKGLPGAPGAPASTTVGLANWLDSWDDDAKSTWSNGTGSAPMGMGMGMGAMRTQGMRTQVGANPGDWQCPNADCLNHRNKVFAKHSACPACGMEKPEEFRGRSRSPYRVMAV
mmetsp:Transcript_83530/g.236783  ORF Transcript_83530/g.236783 Transcript_83530/m.236783 type:complete len:216 (-) Transcript_83530:72-719(-)